MDNFGEVIDAFLQRFPVRLHIRQTNDAAIDIDAPVRWLQERQPAIQWVFKTPGIRPGAGIGSSMRGWRTDSLADRARNTTAGSGAGKRGARYAP